MATNLMIRTMLLAAACGVLACTEIPVAAADGGSGPTTMAGMPASAPTATPLPSPAADAADSGPVRRFVYLDENPELSDLVRKARAYEERGNWSKAFHVYHEVMQRATETTLLRLDSRTFGHLRGWVRRHLASLPAQRLHEYRLLYDAEAKRRLAEALTPLSVGKLEQVAAVYFVSSVGDEALDILGDVYRERREWRRAVACWQRVLDVYPATRLPRAHLWAKVAAGHLALRERSRAEEAIRHLRGVVGPAGAVTVAGEPAALVSRLEAEAARLPAPPGETPITRTTWPQVGGSAQHTGVMPFTGHADVRTWTLQLDQLASACPLDANTVALLRAHGRRLPRIGFPFVRPVASNGRIFIHDRQTVYAIEARTGNVAWSYKDPASAGPRGNRVFGSKGWGSLEVSQTSCAVAGGRVLALLGGLHRAGGPRVVAIDERTGRLLWEQRVVLLHPGTQRVIDPLLAVSEVLAADNAVFIMATVPAQKTPYGGLDYHVLALDADDGKVRWDSVVCTSLPPSMYRGAAPGGPSLTVPAADADRLYVTTNSGAVVSLDLRTGEVVWVAEYEASARGAGRALPRLVGAAGPREGAADAWRSTAPLVAGGVVYVTPWDADALLALDAATGRLVWRRPQGSAVYVAGVHENRLFTVGREVEAVDAATGALVWRRRAPGTFVPAGPPFLTAAGLFVPAEDRVYQFSLRDGTVVATLEYDPRDPAAERGHVAAVGSTLVTVSGSRVNGFGDRVKVLADLAARVAADPKDAEALFEMGGLFDRSDDHERAIAEYEKALAVCPDALRYQERLLRRVLTDRLCDHYASVCDGLLHRGTPAEALVHAKAALSYAADGPQRLQARIRLARVYDALKDYRQVANTWQDMLTHEAPEAWPLPDGGMVRAWFYARLQLDRLIKTHGRAVYAEHDAAADALLAQNTRESRQRLVARYPNSRAAGTVVGAAPGGHPSEVVSETGQPHGAAPTGGPNAALPNLPLPLAPAWHLRVPGMGMHFLTVVGGRDGAAGAVILGCLGPVVSLDAVTGKERWHHYRIEGLSRIQRCASAGSSMVVADANGIARLNLESGAVAWSRAAPDLVDRAVAAGPEKSGPEGREASEAASVGALALADAGVLLLRTRTPAAGGHAAPGVELAFLDGATGDLLWLRRMAGSFQVQGPVSGLLLDEATRTAPTTRLSAARYGGPSRGTAFVALQDPSRIVALDLEDGSPRREWGFAAKPDGRLLAGPCSLGPNRACAVRWTGTAPEVVALDPRKEGFLWSRPLQAAPAGAEHPIRLEVLAGRLLVTGGSGECAALDPVDGRVVWTAPVRDGAPGVTHIVGPTAGLFLVSQTADPKTQRQAVHVTAVRATTGMVLWTIQLAEDAVTLDATLSATHLLVSVLPFKTETRTTRGGQEVAVRVSTRPKVFVVRQDDGRVDATLELKPSNPGWYTSRPAPLVIFNGRLILTDLTDVVAFAPAEK